MTRSYDILVAGEINPDLILSDPGLSFQFGQQETLVEDATLTIGSSSAIFACGAARLGLRVGFIGVAGDDFFGSYMLQAMREKGVDVSPVVIDPAQKTGLSVIFSRGVDRAIITHPGAMQALRAEQVTDERLVQARHLHVASYYLQTALQSGLPDLFHRARRLGLTISLDTNWDPSGEWVGMDALLGMIDIFLPNEAEVLSLARAANLDGALDRLARDSLTLAVKLGSKGGAARRGNERVSAPAIPVQVVDTVGAGDSFDAGFICGFLRGWDLLQSLRLGVVCGSLSTRHAGGTAAQPTLDEALEAMHLAF